MPLLESFVGLLGLCVGSFLNVVIYRLPLGLSLTNPSRSFCPQCRSQLAWFDNIPVLSWLVLRGKCRSCAAPISVQYPLVEAFTGLAFVLVFHLLFVVHARVGVPLSPGPADGWLLLVWLVFVAVAIAFSAMDIVSYSIDIRLTDFAMVVALICYALWPLPNTYLASAQAPAAGAALAAGIASGVMLWLTVWRKPLPTHELPASVDTPDAPPHSGFDAAVASASGVSRFGGLIGVFAAFVLGCVLIAGSAEAGSGARPAWPIAAALALFFGGTVLAGAIPRASDHELASAIEEETPHARRAAWGELLWLLPIILVGSGVWWLLHSNPAARSSWAAAAGWTPGYGIYPIGGIAFSMYGIVVAAAAGWLLRIVFTLAFGKEAFGTGDIYILAAAGAATGADIALLGLVFAVGLALLGWLLGVLLKSAAMIPFGPWLSIGFLLALWWNRPAVARIDQYAGALAEAWNQRPDVVFVLGGVLLVGSVVAVGLAKLARRLTEPRVSG